MTHGDFPVDRRLPPDVVPDSTLIQEPSVRSHRARQTTLSRESELVKRSGIRSVGEGQMADGKWQMADGKWQMADGRWRVHLTFLASAGQTRDITREAFWPPKPKLLEIALCRGISLAVLGT